jgi:ubiquinone/menaquinone biosynthesis C-methylase UbiE
MSRDAADLRFWDRNAHRYDRSMVLLGRPMAPMLRRLEEAARGTGRVLEVAAGTGIVTVALARTAREVVATDLSEAMLTELRRKVEGLGLTHVRCERADLTALPYASGEFDLVVAANVLHLVPDVGAALAELVRVVRPGGRVAVPTFCHGQSVFTRAASGLARLGGFPVRRKLTLAALAGAVEGAGLAVDRALLLPGVFPIGHVEGVRPD